MGPLRGGESPVTKPRRWGARRALVQDKQMKFLLQRFHCVFVSRD